MNEDSLKDRGLPWIITIFIIVIYPFYLIKEIFKTLFDNEKTN